MHAVTTLILAFSSLCAALPVARADNPPPTTPNVLFVYVEDTNLDVSLHNPVVQTPHLDRLALRGVVFDQAYCPYPLCSPSRAAVLSGMRPPTTGRLANEDPPVELVNAGVPILPLFFQQSGYYTAGLGKVLHRSFFHDAAWDEHYIRGDDTWIIRPPNPDPPGGFLVVYWGPFLNGADGSLGKMADTKLADKAIELLGSMPEPFFLTMGLSAPHNPYIYPEAFDSLYDPRNDVPPLPAQEYNSDWRDGLPPWMYSSRMYLDPYYDNDPELGRREATVAYWRTISFIDAEMGRVLDSLEQLGLDDRTVVVFVSDHGFSMGQHGRYGKGRLFDHSLRVPFVVSVPWMTDAHGSRCSFPVETLDIYGTLADLCGLAPPTGLESRSIAGLVEDPVDATRARPAAIDMTGLNRANHQRAVRSQQYKFIYWESGRHMLYDLVQDRGEYNNLYGDPAYDPIVEQHLQLLKDDGWLEAAWNHYFFGHPGELGEPALTPTAPPILGTSSSLLIDSSSSQTEFAVLFTGIAGSLTPFFDGYLLVRPGLPPRSFLLPPGQLSYNISIPNDPLLEGLSVVLQIAQTDLAASRGLALSKGLRLFMWPN